jgi:hypothetical protein
MAPNASTTCGVLSEITARRGSNFFMFDDKNEFEIESPLPSSQYFDYVAKQIRSTSEAGAASMLWARISRDYRVVLGRWHLRSLNVSLISFPNLPSVRGVADANVPSPAPSFTRLIARLSSAQRPDHRCLSRGSFVQLVRRQRATPYEKLPRGGRFCAMTG